MSVKLLGYLCLLLVALCPSWAEQQQQQCLTSANNCDECIQSGPACAWCIGPHANTRCHTVKGLRRAGCRRSDMYNPQGRVQVVKNDSSTGPANAKALSLQPREVSLRLRPGVSQSFPLTITMPTDQPITELTMVTSPVPAGVNITFSNIMNENPLVVQVTVEAAQCPSERDDLTQNRTGPWPVHITPRGFALSVKLEITLEYSCRSGPKAPVCSGRGKCEEGFCMCDVRMIPEERYSGQYCECNNFDCPYHNGRICGGHGRCECGRCRCDDDWTGEDCICTMESASCLSKNQKLCDDKGMCQCGVCKCERPYGGRTCEDFPF
ncbi:uncharacterized protein PEZ65_006340 isoform 2-T3 [Lycodopsis pacificus]